VWRHCACVEVCLPNRCLGAGCITSLFNCCERVSLVFTGPLPSNTLTIHVTIRRLYPRRRHRVLRHFDRTRVWEHPRDGLVLNEIISHFRKSNSGCLLSNGKFSSQLYLCWPLAYKWLLKASRLSRFTPGERHTDISSEPALQVRKPWSSEQELGWLGKSSGWSDFRNRSLADIKFMSSKK
jgi:hypothetical protein